MSNCISSGVLGCFEIVESGGKRRSAEQEKFFVGKTPDGSVKVFKSEAEVVNRESEEVPRCELSEKT